jgi:hypothetical protein
MKIYRVHREMLGLFGCYYSQRTQTGHQSHFRGPIASHTLGSSVKVSNHGRAMASRASQGVLRLEKSKTSYQYHTFLDSSGQHQWASIRMVDGSKTCIQTALSPLMIVLLPQMVIFLLQHRPGIYQQRERLGGSGLQ